MSFPIGLVHRAIIVSWQPSLAWATAVTRQELIDHLGLKPCVQPPLPDHFFRQPGEPSHTEETARAAYSDTLRDKYIQTGKLKKVLGRVHTMNADAAESRFPPDKAE